MDFSQQYLKTIPPIYRDVLEAFPRISPSRKKGDSLAISTIYANMENEKKSYSIGEIREACKNLADNGVLENRYLIFVHPTDLGEELIASLTGSNTPEKSIPPFPRIPLAISASRPRE